MKKRKGTKKIIVHCSDSDYATHDNLETIRFWHKNERNFSDIGYHFVILKDGTISHGRELNLIGAHCKDQNHDSIGICLTGKKKFSNEQYNALTNLCAAMKLIYGDLQVLPHNFYNKHKTCPNFSLGLFDLPIMFRED
jgi:N-acetyl-anhydromuramyl-L-alanine amidase AmpD